MKINTSVKMILLFVYALLVASCSSGTVQNVPGADAGAGKGGTDPSGGTANVGSSGDTRSTGGGDYYSPQQAGSANAITLSNLNNPNSLLIQRIIYFDYNKATVRPEYQVVLDAHAELLAANPQLNVRLEGHADERGTREFNVALSEERAKAIEWNMRGQGMSSSQAELVAYGEERPAVVGDGERSWQRNRRVEIKYPGR